MLTRSLIAFAVMAAAATAQIDDCPHDTVKAIGSKVTIGEVVNCPGVTGTIAGVTISGGGGCPLWVLIEPPRCISIDDPKSKTYTYRVNDADVRLQNFGCKRTWFLFIPTGYSCRLTQSVVTNQLANYAADPCFNARASS